ncbi:MAG: hypothetical protein HKN76_17695 [Saprospiraceae bacterium]|nr:hypothetical protein [Saprospiraceae bacterium]
MKHLFSVMRNGNPNVKFPNNIVINDYKLHAEDLLDLSQTDEVYLQPGHYWYDTRSGLFGHKEEPLMGTLKPGHNFGSLSAQASNGDSGVFINGRELQEEEALQLSRLFCYYRKMPGRYWLDASGDMGDEGYPFVTGNIYLAISIAQKYNTSPSNNFWARRLSQGQLHWVATAS